MKRETFAGSVEEFAAKRRGMMEEFDAGLEPHVADALKRVGLKSWEYHLVEYAGRLFRDLVESESEEWGQVQEDLQAEFKRELSETLQKTTPVPADRFATQVQTVTRWVSAMTINAATEAAVAADSDDVGLEWVTMEDDKVRRSHREMNGIQVPTGFDFELEDGTKVQYPGQPKGDPANWINCRCVARPTLLENGGIIAAAAQKEKPVAEEPVAETEEELDDAPEIPSEVAMMQVPWHGVLAPEGVPSGDGRMFAADALTWRDLPLPIKSMFVDDEGHKGSVVTARIDRIFREDGLIKAEGVFDTSPEAYESVRMLAEGMWRGVSVDIDAAELAVEEFDETGGMNLVFSKGRICAATLCAIPAFAEAWVKLGLWADDPTYKKPEDAEEPVEEPTEGEPTDIRRLPKEEAAEETEQFRPVPPQTKDGPGWITHPDPTEDITNYWVDGRGAAKIRWGQGGDFNRCRMQLAKYVQNPDWLAGLCANLHYRALGIWPGEHKASGGTTAMSNKPIEDAEVPSVSLVASAATATRPSVDLFKNPQFTAVTPLTVNEETGEVFGHIASWDTCHVANPEGPGICTTAPHSLTDYAYFLTGEIETDAGPVPVGRLSFGGGHADGRLGLVAAMAHYDNVATAFADVYCGEDEHGIWVHGLMREGLTAKDIREFRSSPPSGDWRKVVVNGAEQLEMIAVCSVNVPGFPVPRINVRNNQQLSLIAAGVVPVEPVDEESEAEVTEALNARGERIAKFHDAARQLRYKSFKAKLANQKEK